MLDHRRSHIPSSAAARTWVQRRACYPCPAPWGEGGKMTKWSPPWILKNLRIEIILLHQYCHIRPGIHSAHIEQDIDFVGVDDRSVVNDVTVTSLHPISTKNKGVRQGCGTGAGAGAAERFYSEPELSNSFTQSRSRSRSRNASPEPELEPEPTKNVTVPQPWCAGNTVTGVVSNPNSYRRPKLQHPQRPILLPPPARNCKNYWA